MLLPRLRLVSRLAWLPGALIVGSVGSSARAQQSFNPPGFDPYSAPYRAYAFPGAGNNPSIPNSQITGAGIVTANPLNGVGSLEDDVFSLGGGPSAGYFPTGHRRYDSAYRMRDEALGRGFVPNEKADADFYKDRKKREDLQIKLMRETDRREQEAILKDLDRLKSRSLDSSLSVRRGGSSGPVASTRRATTPARPRTATSTPSARGTTPAATGSQKPSASDRSRGQARAASSAASGSPSTPR